MDINDQIKPTLAEYFGTLTLVFIGAGAGALAVNSSAGLAVVAPAHGVALMVIIYDYFWIYLVGPVVGALAAGLLWNYFFLPKTTPAPQPLTRRPRR